MVDTSTALLSVVYSDRICSGLRGARCYRFVFTLCACGLCCAFQACGHDGHAVMLAGALEQLARQHRGDLGDSRVLGVFQPAEETGAGAAQMVGALPDMLGTSVTQGAFAFHNIPGEPLGDVLFVPEGVAARVRSLHVFCSC